MAIFQIWDDFPVEKLKLKISNSSCLAGALRNVKGKSSGPLASLLHIWRMASSSSSFLKAAQQLPKGGLVGDAADTATFPGGRRGHGIPLQSKQGLDCRGWHM